MLLVIILIISIFVFSNNDWIDNLFTALFLSAIFLLIQLMIPLQVGWGHEASKVYELEELNKSYYLVNDGYTFVSESEVIKVNKAQITFVKTDLARPYLQLNEVNSGAWWWWMYGVTLNDEYIYYY